MRWHQTSFSFCSAHGQFFWVRHQDIHRSFSPSFRPGRRYIHRSRGIKSLLGALKLSLTPTAAKSASRSRASSSHGLPSSSSIAGGYKCSSSWCRKRSQPLSALVFFRGQIDRALEVVRRFVSRLVQ